MPNNNARRQLLDEPCVDTEFDDDLDDEDVTCTSLLDKGIQPNMKIHGSCAAVAYASIQTEPVCIPHSVSIVPCFQYMLLIILTL